MTDESMDAFVRKIVREEIASLAALHVRRMALKKNDIDSTYTRIQSVWGEALTDFGGTEDEPGDGD